MLKSHINLIKKLKKRLPIKEVYLEYGKFDLQKINNPKVKGIEYQEGKQKGYGNVQEYVLCRDRHQCIVCKKKNKVLHVHHLIWKKNGGANTPENLVTLCEKCHEQVHKNTKKNIKLKKLFAGISKRQVHTTLLNTIMPSFLNWLEAEFEIITITFGYKTKEKRRELNLPKEHYVDAYLISLKTSKKTAIKIDFKNSKVYEYKQIRRHHRQIVHAIRDRNYKTTEKNKIVAKNRKKRMGQTEDSLADFIEKNGKNAIHNLRILLGKKVIRSNFKDFAKGDVVHYLGKFYIVKGYGEMGRRLGFVGCKNYVLTKYCKLVARNKGIICL